MQQEACTDREKKIVEISLVVPMYNEEEMLDIFFDRISECMKKVTNSYEIVCINDGSKDDTWKLLSDHQKKKQTH